MITTRRTLFVAVSIALVVCAVIWLKPRPASSPKEKTVAPVQKSVTPTKSDAVGASAEVLAALSQTGDPLSSWSWVDLNQQALDRALATRDPFKWKPVLGELLNPHYKREEAIAVLARLLENPDWDVKTTASWLMLELGSYAGVPVLQSALRAAAGGELSVNFAEQAAEKLHHYRQVIDAQDLYEAFQRFNTPLLREIATMQQLPEMRDLVLQKRANRQLGYDTEWMAAYLGMTDADSVEQYKRLLTAYPKAQLLGHWALYRALGQEADLDYVISTVRQVAGMEPRTERSQPGTGTRELALDLLTITIEPKVTKVLEEIADHIANSPNGNSVDFAWIFGALYYLHKDDVYVNQRALEFLRGQYRGPGVDRGLLINIAASRRTPEIDAAAIAFSPTAYSYVLNQVEGRPAESWWANLLHVPITLAPPLPTQKP